MKLLTCYLVNEDGSEERIAIDESSPAWSMLYHEFYQRRIINIQRRWRAKHGRLFQDSKAHSNIPISLNLRLPGLTCNNVRLLQRVITDDNPLELYDTINKWPSLTESSQDQLKQCLLTLLVTKNISLEQYATVSLLTDAMDWLKQATPGARTLCHEPRFIAWDDPDAPFSLKDTRYPNREKAHEQMSKRMAESELSTIESGYYMLQLPQRYFHLLMFMVMSRPNTTRDSHYNVLHKVFTQYLSYHQERADIKIKPYFSFAITLLGEYDKTYSTIDLMEIFEKIAPQFLDKPDYDWVGSQLTSTDPAIRQNINFLANMLTYRSFFYTLWQHPDTPHTLSLLLPSSSSQQIAATCLFGETCQQPWYTTGAVSTRYIHRLAYQPKIDLFPGVQRHLDKDSLRRPIELVSPLIAKAKVVHGFKKIHPFLLSMHDHFHISLANDSLCVLRDLEVHHNKLFSFVDSSYHRPGVREFHMSKPLWTLADLDLIASSTILDPALDNNKITVEASYFCQVVHELNRGCRYNNASTALDLLLIDMQLNPDKWHAFREDRDGRFFWHQVIEIDPDNSEAILNRYHEIKGFLDSCSLSAEAFHEQDKLSVATILLRSYFMKDISTEIYLKLFDEHDLELSDVFYWHRQDGFTLRKPFQLLGCPKSIYQDADGKAQPTNQFADDSMMILQRSFILLYLNKNHGLSLTDAAILVGDYETMVTHTDERVAGAIGVMMEHYSTAFPSDDVDDTDESRVAPLP